MSLRPGHVHARPLISRVIARACRRILSWTMLGAAACTLAGCVPAMKVAKVDPSTGFLHSEKPIAAKAERVRGERVDLSKHKDLLLVTGYTPETAKFLAAQISEIGVFDSVVTLRELEEQVIRHGLQDRIVSLDSQIALSRVARHYKPFLWLHPKTVRENDKSYGSLVLRDAATATDLFEARIDWSFGTSDETFWYPLFNELIAWVNENRQGEE